MKIILDFESFAEMMRFCRDMSAAREKQEVTTAPSEPTANALAQGVQASAQFRAQQGWGAQAQPPKEETGERLSSTQSENCPPATTASPTKTIPGSASTPARREGTDYRSMRTVRQVIAAIRQDLSGADPAAADKVVAGDVLAMAERLLDDQACPVLAAIPTGDLKERILATCEQLGIPIG